VVDCSGWNNLLPLGSIFGKRHCEHPANAARQATNAKQQMLFNGNGSGIFLVLNDVVWHIALCCWRRGTNKEKQQSYYS
jgi:isoaspartyl peptidase/L-asparaginase-like protein (Ntn-hydrolase superfamily)